MSEAKVRALLRAHGFRSTRGRVDLLTVLRGAGRPLAQTQILERLPDTSFNRVSIYRALEALVEAGLVHRAYHDGRTWTYETSDHCDHVRCHPHFTCMKCGRVRCLTETVAPLVRLPKGYTLTRQQVQVEGLCPACARPASGKGEKGERHT